MRRAPVIARRELGSYFHSARAYGVLAAFLIACAFIFRRDFQPGQVAGMRYLFEWMVFFLVFKIPILGMGLIAQELDSGTIETLMTAPVEETDVIVGKFLGSFSFFILLLIPTLFYVAMLAIYSTPSFDLGPILSGYLGIVLVAGLFTSVALFCSSLTRSQLIAAISAVAILFTITILPMLAAQETMLPEFWRNVVDQSVFRRYTDFSRGVIDTG